MTDNTAIHHSQVQQDDLLWRQLKSIPAFRALLRAVESRFYQQLDLPGPVLDVGCGDGHFAQMTFTEPVDVGIDPWWGPLKKAQQTGAYKLVLQSRGDCLPFPDHTFGSAISNSVLEHIPDVQAVLNEVSRVLQPGGRFVITMPSHAFTENLGGARFFEALGGPFLSLADGYRRFFNFISRHAHTQRPEVWAERLTQAGFQIERWQYYFSTGALRALEWGHVQGLPSAVLHFLTGHWIVAPWQSNLQRTERWVRPYYEEEAPNQASSEDAIEAGAYLLFVARKAADHPVQVMLPAARPFKQADFSRAHEPPSAAVAPTPDRGEQETADHPAQVEAVNQSEIAAAEPMTATLEPGIQPMGIKQLPAAGVRPPLLAGKSKIVSVGLLLLTLWLIIIGQSRLSANLDEPAAGLRWFGYGFITLLLGAWWQSRRRLPALPQWHLPRLSDLPWQRWLYFPALLLTFTAQRMAGAAQPGLALFLWVCAIALAIYALASGYGYRLSLRAGIQITAQGEPFTLHRSKFTIFTALILFVVALLIRAVALTDHPYILNGTEASIGLDALNVARGVGYANPFATGWLTNPTLPLYLLAVPVKLLGPSILSIRLLSPLVGAMSVVAVYGLGQRLWGREVGLTAAVLLAGSHFHIHYSRLGLTNIWDPLLVLLALGLMAIAWEEENDNRLAWLLVGGVVGLNAYFFTASRLLPLMLATWLLLAFALRPQRRMFLRHLLAAAALALIVSLPLMLYYRQNPMIFMEQANSLGILDGQSGWLSREVATTGLSRSEILRQQFWQAALGFNAAPDKSSSYGPQVPLLNFGTAIFFVLGFLVSLLHWRQFRYQMLLVWVAVTIIFGGALLESPPQSHRLIIAAPALALLAAIALTYVGRIVLDAFQARAVTADGQKLVVGRSQVSPSGSAQQITKLADQFHQPTRATGRPFSFLRQQAMLVGLLVIAGLFSASDLLFYFGRYADEHSFADRNTEIADGIAQYLDSLDSEWIAYFYGPPFMYISFPTIPFLAPHFQANTTLFDVFENGELVMPDPQIAASHSNRVFIYVPERAGEVTTAQALYPNGRLLAFPGFNVNPLFYAYEVRNR